MCSSDLVQAAGVPLTLNRIGSMMTCFFSRGPVRDYNSAMTANTDMYARHYRNMLADGIWLGPSQFEAFFLSAAHEKRHLQKILDAAGRSFRNLMHVIK